ncbi:hypothetical protein [Cytobacillus purgationiresistens]|uniref:Uncharacterized protein n=1 Tax=Cytobacillus purgationiresistens TaxID=863449 RepID=A0ABU0AIW6_9BACI|nr:hypothetical protein [Cytobacillus purgationiresistens]MDQ0270814.1 hypothetical protein [Cytobacillus purgationiresistens]
MKKKMNENKVEPNVNVEFGMEFGDMNASKIYEITNMNNEKTSNKKKNP